MTRLQKKCLVAAAGAHLLALVALLCSGFVASKPKPDDTQILDVIPATAIDQALTSGVRATQPPPPQPVVSPQPPTPTPPKPEVKPDEPVKPPTPVKPTEDNQPPEIKPVERSEPRPKHEVTPDLVKIVPRTTSDTAKREAEARAAARAAKRLRDEQARAFAAAASNLKNDITPTTEIEMPGTSSASYANYGAIVVSVYHHAWIAPDNMADSAAVVSFSVTISRDGSVLSSHIDTPSGDASLDRAVQRMLDRVSFIHEFPDDTTDRERTYHIDFNATRTSIQ